MKDTNEEMEAAEVRLLEFITGDEGYVKAAYLRTHFGMSRATVWRSIAEGMPVTHMGRRLLRFKISEVQRWLEENGRERLARNGTRATVEALRKWIAANPVLRGIEVVEGQGIEK